jgi:hypothetical protein
MFFGLCAPVDKALLYWGLVKITYAGWLAEGLPFRMLAARITGVKIERIQYTHDKQYGDSKAGYG